MKKILARRNEITMATKIASEVSIALVDPIDRLNNGLEAVDPLVKKTIEIHHRVAGRGIESKLEPVVADTTKVENEAVKRAIRRRIEMYRAPLLALRTAVIAIVTTVRKGLVHPAEPPSRMTDERNGIEKRIWSDLLVARVRKTKNVTRKIGRLPRWEAMAMPLNAKTKTSTTSPQK